MRFERESKESLFVRRAAQATLGLLAVYALAGCGLSDQEVACAESYGQTTYIRGDVPISVEGEMSRLMTNITSGSVQVTVANDCSS